MKFIITEEQNLRLKILRRLDVIWEAIRNSYPFVYPCDYHGLGHFAAALKSEFFIYADEYYEEDEDELWDIISKIFGKKIKVRYDESNCNREPVIEESDSHEQKKWKRFEMFMRRRGEQIRDLILKHSQDYKRSNSNYGKDVVVDKMFELVVADFCDINKIGYDDKEYDWVYFYLQDNYTDYIMKELGFLDKDTITESEKERLQVLRRVNGEDWIWIRDIVDEGTDLYDPCQFETEEKYLESVSKNSANTYLHYYLNDWKTELFSTLSLYIQNLIKKKMGNDIIEYYTYKKEDDGCN